MIERITELFFLNINNLTFFRFLPEIWLSFFALIIIFYIYKTKKKEKTESSEKLFLTQKKIIMILSFIGIIGSFLFCLYFLNFYDSFTSSKTLFSNWDYVLKAYTCMVGFFLINLIYLYLSVEKLTTEYEVYPMFLLILVCTMLLISTFDVLIFFALFEIFIFIIYSLSIITKHISIFLSKLSLMHFFAIFLMMTLFQIFLSIIYVKVLTMNILDSKFFSNLFLNFQYSEFKISFIFCFILFIFFVFYNTGLFPFNKWIVNIYEDQSTIVTIILSCLQPIIFFPYLIKISFFFSFIFDTSYKFIAVLGLFNLLINAFLLPNQQMSLKRFIICTGLFQIGIAISIMGMELLAPFELIYFYSYTFTLINIQMWYIYFFLYRFFGVDEESTEFKTGAPLCVNDLVDLYFTNKVWFCITLFPFFLNLIIFLKFFRVFEDLGYYDIFSGVFLLTTFFIPIIYYLKIIKLLDFKKDNKTKKRFLLSFRKFDFILVFNFILLLVLFCIIIVSFLFFDSILFFIQDQNLGSTVYCFSDFLQNIKNRE